jgi:cysteinyl-tRNA synthetase
VKVFNTLSGQKEEFKPQGDVITMYVCGVTVYAECHIGHAMSYVIFDVIRRYLKFRGYKVKHVQNFTDIDDKIIERANQLGISSSELSGKYIESYFTDMDALNIARADVYPYATKEVPKIIEMVQGLIDKGYAYESAGSVYYRVQKFSDYGKLSHRKLSDIESRDCAYGVEKDHPLDFVLWKASKPDEPSWESPWGQGRPGWHIECSAMALRYLGDSIDIHGGGQDLVFPHHENEITQSESYTGVKPFAHYWIHNGLLQLDKQKMSKSLGNLITVKDMLERFSSDAIRLFILGSHYRSPLLFSDESLVNAEKAAERLRVALERKGTDDAGMANLDVSSFENKFIEVMDDDFNTAQALAVLFDLAREINRAIEEGMRVSDAQEILLKLAGLLGLTLKREAKKVSGAEPFIDLLVSVREDLRREKQWQLADKIRNSLVDAGVIIEDNPGGTIWKYK